MRYSPPEPLNATHNTQLFCCGETVLDTWIQKTALKNQISKASRTFVVCDENKRVVAYYAIATGSISHQVATGNIRRNMPDPVPAIILGRLAVDKSLQGKGFGAGLVQDAILRVLQISEQVGVRALFVNALNQKAKQFYLEQGFQPSPVHEMMLMLKLSD